MIVVELEVVVVVDVSISTCVLKASLPSYPVTSHLHVYLRRGRTESESES